MNILIRIASELREEAVKHYKQSAHCSGAESDYLWQAGYEMDDKAQQLEHFVANLNRKA